MPRRPCCRPGSPISGRPGSSHSIRQAAMRSPNPVGSCLRSSCRCTALPSAGTGGERVGPGPHRASNRMARGYPLSDQRIGAQQLRESDVDFRRVAGLQYNRLLAELGRSGLCIGLLVRSIRIVWIHQQRDAREIWHQFAQQLDALCAEHARDKGYPRDIAAGPIEARHQPEADGITADGKNDRNDRARVSCRARGSDVSGRGNGDNPLRHQFGRERSQGLIVAVCPPLLDTDVAALDEARLCQTFPNGGVTRCAPLSQINTQPVRSPTFPPSHPTREGHHATTAQGNPA